MTGLRTLLVIDALIAAGAELVPIEPPGKDLGPLPDDLPLVPNAKAIVDEISFKPIRREYPETPAPARDRPAESSRYMPHIGKKQIAKALRRAAKGVTA